MQKSLMTVALRATMAGMAFLALGAAQAQTAIVNNGTIDFAGSISASTCSVKSGDRNKRVTLPTVKPKDFTDAAITTGQTTFTITLEGCTISPPGATGADVLPSQALVKFSGSSINSNNRLDNRGTAKGVEIQLSGTGTPTPIQLVAGDNALSFTAAYYSTTKDVVSGTVNAQVNFDITYQ